MDAACGAGRQANQSEARSVVGRSPRTRSKLSRIRARMDSAYRLVSQPTAVRHKESGVSSSRTAVLSRAVAERRVSE